jgi:hypothetical protein
MRSATAAARETVRARRERADRARRARERRTGFVELPTNLDLPPLSLKDLPKQPLTIEAIIDWSDNHSSSELRALALAVRWNRVSVATEGRIGADQGIVNTLYRRADQAEGRPATHSGTENCPPDPPERVPQGF